ncbi:hypothetical protein B0J11DRAFT_89917 [Dendryphion nanum]|uniref:Uncharacterized protein n=1 Tax=Dendryphion nanum TaxID=256645 RepID=A0A9P9IEE3_9PLEO|nr:hypothetical protein B0J11DRAFT_89917 [Dendryphion nanum]
MASPTSNANVPTPVPFPHPDSQPQQNASTNSPTSPTSSPRRPRTLTNTSIASATRSIRTASVKLMEADPPPGMWAATGTVAAKAPTLAEIRRGSFSSTGWNEESQRHKAERRASQSDEAASSPRRKSATDTSIRPGMGKFARTGSSGVFKEPVGTEPFPAVTEEEMSSVPTRGTDETEHVYNVPKYDGQDKDINPRTHSKHSSEATDGLRANKFHHDGPERQYSNGYVPPPKVPWTTSFVIGMKAFWKWFLTIPGFLITLYGLNVVAWGGMLFLLLCNAAPAMCVPTCNDIQSPRRIWIEIDSQILNALFCVTGFGLAPWRSRDVFFWGKWRLGGSKHKLTGIRRLAGIHRGWFRLPGSDALPPLASVSNTSPDDPAVPIPHSKIPDPPPTGIHAPPTKGWKMDFVVWMNMSNTFFQIILCFYMWHYNRYDRPSWATGLFVALGCIVAGVGGIMMYHEGKYVKKVEGVPVPKGYENQIGDVEAPTTTQSESIPLVAGSGKAAQT